MFRAELRDPQGNVHVVGTPGEAARLKQQGYTEVRNAPKVVEPAAPKVEPVEKPKTDNK